MKQPKTPHPLSSPEATGSSASEIENSRVFRFSFDSCSKESVDKNESVASSDSTTPKTPDNPISKVL